MTQKEDTWHKKGKKRSSCPLKIEQIMQILVQKGKLEMSSEVDNQLGEKSVKGKRGKGGPRVYIPPRRVAVICFCSWHPQEL